MNELARNALRAAALAGVRQIRGYASDAVGGRCAFGVLVDTGGQDLKTFGLGSHRVRCPLCPDGRREEWMLLIHLNDYHRCDFLKIASLMPVSEEDP